MSLIDTRWLNLVQRLLDSGESVKPRAKATRELLAPQTVLDMEHPVLTVRGRDLGYRFMLAEAAWILSGDNRVATIAPFAKKVAEFSDDGYTFAGAYGPPLRDQLPWVVQQLVKDPATRQAVATIWRPRPGPSRDVPCTVAVQWLLRDDLYRDGTRLHCVMTMRSSDIWLGAPYDWFNFSCVSAWVAAEYLRQRPDSGPVRLGRLYFTPGSQHLYEGNLALARGAMLDPEPLFEVPAPLDPAPWAMDPDNLINDLWSAASYAGSAHGSRFINDLAWTLRDRHNARLKGRDAE